MEILRKLTIKHIMGEKIDIEKVLAAPDKTLKVAKIFGTAAKATPDQSEYGAYIRFKGRFRGINFETGVTYEAGSLILPPVAQDYLAGAVDSLIDGGAVEFAFEISVKYDKDAVTKYVYEVRPLFEPSKDDPMERMQAQVLALADKSKDVDVSVDKKAK